MRGKYIGLVERLTESMAGCDIQIIAKFSKTKKELTEWAKAKYPNSKFIILDNTPEREEFFDLSSIWSMEIKR